MDQYFKRIGLVGAVPLGSKVGTEILVQAVRGWGAL